MNRSDEEALLAARGEGEGGDTITLKVKTMLSDKNIGKKTVRKHT